VHAHLDSIGLDVRGGFHLRFSVSEIRRTEVSGPVLRLVTDRGVLELELGKRVKTWERTIREPRSRIDKLGIKPGARTVLVGLNDSQLRAELAARKCNLLKRGVESSVDAVFFLVAKPSALTRLKLLKRMLVPSGALWVIREKGGNAKVTEEQVRDAARRAGLVDVKVVAFSDTLSAVKLVIPRAQRSK
jgi:hypothetical protein